MRLRAYSTEMKSATEEEKLDLDDGRAENDRGIARVGLKQWSLGAGGRCGQGLTADSWQRLEARTADLWTRAKTGRGIEAES